MRVHNVQTRKRPKCRSFLSLKAPSAIGALISSFAARPKCRPKAVQLSRQDEESAGGRGRNLQVSAHRAAASRPITEPSPCPNSHGHTPLITDIVQHGLGEFLGSLAPRTECQTLFLRVRTGLCRSRPDTAVWPRKASLCVLSRYSSDRSIRRRFFF